MSVFRVEDKKGIGPYSRVLGIYYDLNDEDQLFLDRMVADHNNKLGILQSHTHPAYDIGIGRDMKKNEYCAFQTLELLEKWFAGYLTRLLEIGYSIVEIDETEVEITAISNKQILFKYIKEEALRQKRVMTNYISA